MAFTGRLGIEDSQLGNIELGFVGGGSVETSFTADAVIFKTQSASFTADAVISGGAGTASFTADAVILKAQSASFTADASISRSFTADAVIKTIQSIAFTADAQIALHRQSQFWANAIINSPRFTADAVLIDAFFRADGVINATATPSFTANAVLFRAAAPSVADDMEIAFEDHFDRVRATGWGDLYVPYFSASETDKTVNGSEATVKFDVGAGLAGYIAPYGPINGSIEFDFWVPANTSDSSGDYYADTGDVLFGLNYYSAYLWVYPIFGGGGDWNVEIGGFDFFTAPFTPDASSWYTAKMLFYPRLGLWRGKVWKRGTAEPDWQVTGTITVGAFGTAASIFVNTFAAEDAKFDNLIVRSFPVVITYDTYEDITDDVQLAEAEFSSAVNGRPGSANLRVRDLGHEHSFTTGRELALELFGRRYWTGYLSTATRGYYFTSTDKPAAQTPRYIELRGEDLNILFQKRILYNKDDPTAGLTIFSAGSSDQQVILSYLDRHVDLDDEVLDTSWVESVGTPETDSDIFGDPGETLGSFMDLIRRNIGSIYYIDPYRRFRYTDVETIVNDQERTLSITDQPLTEGDIGCHDLEIEFNAENMVNDALVWGAGQGRPTMVFSHVEDDASVTEHGRWQSGELSRSIWRPETVERIARSIVYGSPQSLRGAKDDAISVRCTVHTHRFLPADKVPVRSEVHNVDQVFPVRSVNLNWESDVPVFRLVLSHEIDPPWRTFEFWFPPIPDWVFPEFVLPEIPSFDPCADGQCLLDTFQRTNPTEWGTPDIGGAWIESGALGIHVEPSIGYVLDVGSQSGPTGASFTGGTATNHICLRNRMDVYVKWSASGDFYSTYEDGGVLANDGGGSYYFPIIDVTDNPLEVGHYLSIHVPQVTGTGSNLLYITTYQNIGYVFPSFLGTIYRKEPFTFSFTPGVEYYVRIEFDGPDEITFYRVKLWRASDPEPTGWQYDDVIATHTIADDEIAISGARYLKSGESAGPTEVRIHRVEVLGLPESELPLIETFSRTTDGSWGTSEVTGEDWSSSANMEVDGASGVIDGTAAFGGGQGHLAMPMTLPVEFTFDLRWDSIPTIISNSRSGFFINDDHSTSFGPAFLFFPSPAGAILGRIYENDGVGPNQYSTSVTSYAAGNTIHCRIRAEATTLYAKAWSGSEPVGWDKTVPSTSFTPIYLQAYSNHTTASEGYHVYFDNIDGVEGVDVSTYSPCASEDPPDPDPPVGETCQVLTTFSPPPGYPAGNYFASTTNFRSGSTRVWVAGVFMRRGVDYFEGDSYYGGFIHMNDSIDVIGKTVYMCYFADPQLGNP